MIDIAFVDPTSASARAGLAVVSGKQVGHEFGPGDVTAQEPDHI